MRSQSLRDLAEFKNKFMVQTRKLLGDANKINTDNFFSPAYKKEKKAYKKKILHSFKMYCAVVL